MVAAMLARLGGLEGLRLAEAGEFARRAFLNGKFDLTGAEALSDLIAAETEAQRRFALTNAEGCQSRLYALWRRRILHGRAMIEAELDFTEDGDVPGSVASRIWADMQALHEEIVSHIDGYRQAEIIRDGFRVVIAGAPNSGKSSLLNALARRDAAIVSDEPGTTRDILDVTLDLNGDKVIFSDTAGLRDDPGRIEAMGIERARDRLRDADLVLLLEDLASPLTVRIETQAPVWRLGTKADLVHKAASGYQSVIASTTGAGVAGLLAEIHALVAATLGAGMSVLPSRDRHVEQLRACRRSLRTAVDAAEAGLELRAEELRRAGDALGRIAGEIGVEDVLGVIFSEFCVGK